MQQILVNFLWASPLEHAKMLLTWPIWLSLLLMGMLAGIGLYTILKRWFNNFILLGGWIISFWIWTVCYLVASHGGLLLAHEFYRPQAQAPPLVEQIGANLLQPILSLTEEKSLSTKSIIEILATIPEAEYLAALQEQQLSNPVIKDAGDWLVEGALTWLTARHASWPLLSEQQATETSLTPIIPSDLFSPPISSKTQNNDNLSPDQNTNFLMNMLTSLSQPLADPDNDTTIPPTIPPSIAQWQKLVGERFVSRVYGPVVMEAMVWLAAEVSAILLFIQLALLALFWPKKINKNKIPSSQKIAEPIKAKKQRKKSWLNWKNWQNYWKNYWKNCKQMLKTRSSNLQNATSKTTKNIAQQASTNLKNLSQLLSKLLRQEKSFWHKQNRTNEAEQASKKPSHQPESPEGKF